MSDFRIAKTIAYSCDPGSILTHLTIVMTIRDIIRNVGFIKESVDLISGN